MRGMARCRVLGCLPPPRCEGQLRLASPTRQPFVRALFVGTCTCAAEPLYVDWGHAKGRRQRAFTCRPTADSPERPSRASPSPRTGAAPAHCRRARRRQLPFPNRHLHRLAHRSLAPLSATLHHLCLCSHLSPPPLSTAAMSVDVGRLLSRLPPDTAESVLGWLAARGKGLPVHIPHKTIKFARECFALIDTDHSGSLEVHELRAVFAALGQPASAAQVTALVESVAGPGAASLTFAHFAQVCGGERSGWEGARSGSGAQRPCLTALLRPSDDARRSERQAARAAGAPAAGGRGRQGPAAPPWRWARTPRRAGLRAAAAQLG